MDIDQVLSLLYEAKAEIFNSDGRNNPVYQRICRMIAKLEAAKETVS